MQGKHIAVTGARKGEEISKLIVNLGGIPYIRPTQGTVFLDESQVGPDIDRLLGEGADWLILTTGIGSQTLLDMSGRLGRQDELLEFMRNVKIAARGYKTRNFIKGIGIEPDVSDDDGTVRGLIRKFAGIPLEGSRVALQLYGETSSTLTEWLEKEGAECFEIMPYRHIPPEEEDIAAFLREIKEGKFDAIAFTSALQVHYLFEAADQYEAKSELQRMFNGPTLAVAVGIVTAEALEDAGVSRIVQPKNQRMGGMIVEISHYFNELDKA